MILLFLFPYAAMFVVPFVVVHGWWAFTPSGAARLRRRCGRCSYDLRGLPTKTCPECGADNSAFSAVEMMRIRELRRAFLWRSVALTVGCAVLGAIVVGAAVIANMGMTSIGLAALGVATLALAWPCSIFFVGMWMRSSYTNERAASTYQDGYDDPL